MHFINPENIPPEILDAIRAHQDQHNMQHDVQTHEIIDFMKSQTAEGLRVLKGLLAICQDTDNNSYFQGWTTMLGLLKYDKCPCGSDHNPEDLLPPTPQPHVVQPDGTIQTMEEFVEGKPGSLRKEGDEEPATEEQLMEEYGLEWATSDPDDDPIMRCAGCKTPVFSLEDRMKRDPGVKGCSTCQNNAKWG